MQRDKNVDLSQRFNLCLSGGRKEETIPLTHEEGTAKSSRAFLFWSSPPKDSHVPGYRDWCPLSYKHRKRNAEPLQTWPSSRCRQGHGSLQRLTAKWLMKGWDHGRETEREKNREPAGGGEDWRSRWTSHPSCARWRTYECGCPGPAVRRYDGWEISGGKHVDRNDRWNKGVPLEWTDDGDVGRFCYIQVICSKTHVEVNWWGAKGVSEGSIGTVLLSLAEFWVFKIQKWWLKSGLSILTR